MSTLLVTIIAAIGVVGFQCECSFMSWMRKMGVKCGVQETREDMGLNDCDTDSLCSGNCAGCDIDHSEAQK